MRGRQLRKSVGGALPPVSLPGIAVLVFDGVFLHRPELRDRWQLSVHLHVPGAVSLRRAMARDVTRFGGVGEVERRYRSRYLPGQALYRPEADPLRHADVVVDNSDPSNPELLSVRLRHRPGGV